MCVSVCVCLCVRALGIELHIHRPITFHSICLLFGFFQSYFLFRFGRPIRLVPIGCDLVVCPGRFLCYAFVGYNESRFHWLEAQFADRPTDSLAGRLADWLAGWLTGWPAGRLASRLAGWTTGWLAIRPIESLVGWLVAGWIKWVARSPTGWSKRPRSDMAVDSVIRPPSRHFLNFAPIFFFISFCPMSC